MLSSGFQSSAYKKLLAKQQEVDDERKSKLEELRRKQLREEIKRKREEEDIRKKAQAAKETREQEIKQAKLDAEKAERKKMLKREEDERKRPLSVDEAKERREKAEAIRNAGGLSKTKQAPSSSKVLSSKYSSLLATAPTKLDSSSPGRSKSPAVPITKSGQKLSATGNTTKLSSPAKTPSSTSALERRTSRDQTMLPGASPKFSSSKASKVAEKQESQYLQSKPSPAVSKRLPAGTPDLQPLQKNKRDLRTIEEIQNDLHRRNGKNYAYLSSSKTVSTKASINGASKSTETSQRSISATSANTSGARIKSAVSTATTTNSRPKRSRRDSYDSEDSFVTRTSPSRDKRGPRDDGLGGESIWDILNPGKKRDAYLARDIDSDEDMEANAEDIRREEQRASRAAKIEDEKEAALLREKEARKAAKKRKLAAS